MDNVIKDRLFIQEIINDLKRNGYCEGGKADEMLRDWSAELRERSHLRENGLKLCGVGNMNKGKVRY